MFAINGLFKSEELSPPKAMYEKNENDPRLLLVLEKESTV